MIYDRGNCILIAGFTAIVGTIVYDTRSFVTLTVVSKHHSIFLCILSLYVLFIIRLHSCFVRIYFIRISRLRFMKIYECFKNTEPKAEILKNCKASQQIAKTFHLL